MKHLKDFTIQFVGLGIGNHQFEFEVDDAFFEHFEYSQLQHGKVTIGVELEKQERMMIFSFLFQGSVEVTCDRCGEEFFLPVSGNERLIVKFGEEYAEESDEIITIPATEYQIDLSPFIYEYLHLILPARILHPSDREGVSGCNPEILKKLDIYSPHKSSDPRWEVLNKLKQEKNQS